MDTMTETQAKQQKMKPLFGFRALLADIADWIRHHLLTVCFALFILLVNALPYTCESTHRVLCESAPSWSAAMTMGARP